MLFTEPAFLFLFLPLLLLTYAITPARWQNVLLAIASLIFYAFGELRFVVWLLLSIGINYALALWIEATAPGRARKTVLALGIASDLVLLLVFKYAAWFVNDLNQLLAALRLAPLPVPVLALPLGISFFTFHKISYKMDVYRGNTRAQRNPLTLALYILFFPQLIAGPIVRYHDIADQLEQRRITERERFAGIARAVQGLGKKVIIANSMALVADRILDLPPAQVSSGAAWLGVCCYTLQIYFDFSGYSDMAIGLALLFGFHFPENFAHPYSSRSVTEFWRRWHMSLSSWFRDYVYIPLGGNRGGDTRTYFNLILVFFLCGLWHGASFSFVFWGLFHGAFLVLERGWLGAVLVRVPRVLRSAYTLLVVMVGWVFFRIPSFHGALELLGKMFGIVRAGLGASPASSYLNSWGGLMLVIGALLSFPVAEWVWYRLLDRAGAQGVTVAEFTAPLGLIALFVFSVMFLAAATYNPFLYFRF